MCLMLTKRLESTFITVLNNGDDFITTVALILIAVVLFELIIFFHEGGHFIAAKKSGVKVNEFALGMGPKLFSFKKGETTYSFRILPIGGLKEKLLAAKNAGVKTVFIPEKNVRDVSMCIRTLSAWERS